MELRKKGLRWQRRKGVEKRLGFDPALQDSDGEEEAVAAGLAMCERQRALLTQLPELPYMYAPTSDYAAPQAKRKRIRLPSTSSAQPPSQRPTSPDPDASPAKLRRVRLPSNSDAEESHSDSSPHSPPIRLRQ